MKAIPAATILAGAALAILALAMARRPAPAAAAEPAPSAEPAPADDEGLAKATFAGGCFWCMESPFEKLDGVVSAVSGYTGGHNPNPTYEEVCTGTTGHAEAVQITYDPDQVTYRQLLDVFWRNIDPTDAGGQFVDRGSQYRSGIFYHDEEQRTQAEASKAFLASSGRFDQPVVTEITAFRRFYPAEEYHQDFYRTNTRHYERYRQGSGREQFLNQAWGEDRAPEAPAPTEDKTMDPPATPPAAEDASAPYGKPTDEELRRRLSPLQYKVTQEDGTERAFRNEYWDNKRDGLYVDIVSGEPLFSSVDKFKSGTGWPSFTQPVADEYIVTKEDRKLFMTRTEVRSKYGDSHLGHVFDDGPAPTGLRYCINSAALRFIPKEDLAAEGYGEYLRLFEQGERRPQPKEVGGQRWEVRGP